jgi:uncharacterized iron-regulated membrane protein
MSRTGPIWPKVPSGFVRSVLAGHSSLGLFLAALAYLVCVTGTIAVFADELRRWEQPDRVRFVEMAPAAIDRSVDEALKAMPDATSVTFYPPAEDAPRARIAATAGKDEHKVWKVGPDGALVSESTPEWTDFLAEFHANLHARGSVGFVVVGLVGVMMLGLAVSGLLSHPRIFRDAFRLRWGGSRRLQEADLHNRLSVWGLPFNVVVSLTGAYIGLVGSLILVMNAVVPGNDAARAIGQTRAPVFAADPAPAPRLSVAAALDAVRADAAIGGTPINATINRPGTRGQWISLYATLPKRLVYGEYYYVDPAGKLGRVGYSDGPAGVQLYASSYRLHFGSFGGMTVKLLYVALGFGLCVVTSSGVAIWLARRKDQGRPAPGWERIWTTTVWGVLIALAGSALATIAAGADPLAAYWVIQALCWAPALVVRHNARLAFGMKAVLAAVLFVLPIVHVALNGAVAFHPEALAANLTCWASAAGLGVYLRRLRRRGLAALTPAAAT